MAEDTDEYEFDVAVSFAGEDRDYVTEVVEGIKPDVKVFYDEDYQVESWGEDGVEYFTDVYMNRARYTVMFISTKYGEKMWTNVERRSALARAASQRSAYILPVRLDDTELPGLLPTLIYLDSRRIGLSGLIEAIKLKVSGGHPPAPSSALLDGKVPRSQAAIEALMVERKGLWEYLLYAGLLRANIDKLEPKYRDHTMAYARRTGVHLDRDTINAFTTRAIANIQAIVANFAVVLDADVQEAAFGRPGEPGDVDRIVHLAERYVSVYEDFLDWAADLRGATASGDAGTLALRELAKWADQPIAEMRDFVDKFVSEMDTVEERLAASEPVSIEMTVTLTLDSELSQRVVDLIERAMFEE